MRAIKLDRHAEAMADDLVPLPDPTPPDRLSELADELERALADARSQIDAGYLDDSLRAELVRSLDAATELQREAEYLLRLIDPAT